MSSMKLRSGKYAGYTVEQVKIIAPWYINWVKINRPEMLRERMIKKVPKPKPIVKLSPLTPNHNFESEGPERLF